MQHAVCIGLHIFGVGQDFSRVKLTSDHTLMVSRAKLWALTISTCQRYVLLKTSSRSRHVCFLIVLTESQGERYRWRTATFHTGQL